jgi:hypothetical protein
VDNYNKVINHTIYETNIACLFRKRLKQLLCVNPKDRLQTMDDILGRDVDGDSFFTVDPNSVESLLQDLNEDFVEINVTQDKIAENSTEIIAVIQRESSCSY